MHDYGADRASLAFLLIVFKLKTDPAGVALPGIPGKKSRIAISDPNSPRSLPTYAPCADEATGNAVDTIVQAFGMKSVTLDAQAAYFHGKRPTMDEGGRLIFAPIPPYAHLFIPGCPGPDDPDFHQYYFRIDGNMPGLAEAGRIWNTHLVRWLVNDTDMTQSIVDPCIFSRVNDGGREIIIIRVHVDDGLVHYSVVKSLNWFRDKFVAAFGSSSEFADATEDYTGLRFRVTGPNTTEVTCPAIMERLRDLLVPYPLPANVEATYPLPASASLKLREGPGHDNPLVEDKVPMAQKILGVAGWGCVKVSSSMDCSPTCFSRPMSALARWPCGRGNKSYDSGTISSSPRTYRSYSPVPPAGCTRSTVYGSTSTRLTATRPRERATGVSLCSCQAAAAPSRPRSSRPRRSPTARAELSSS